ncbi:MAG: hypothetical protein V3T05_12150, partial [Myxococcota bacterium]
MPIQSSAIAAVAGRIVFAHDSDASVQLAGDDLIELLAALGDRPGVSPSAMAEKLRDPSMSVANKVAEIKKGISDKERRDIEAILDEGTVPLGAESRAILEAVVERPITGFHTVDAAWGVAIPHDASGKSVDSRPAPSARSAQTVGSVLSLQIAALSGDKPDANQVSEKIAGDMIARVKELKDVGGTGVEHWGQGDPDLIERRALFSQLMDQDSLSLDFIEEAWAKSDKKFLEAIERVDAIGGSDYTYSLLTSKVSSAKNA